MNSKIEKLQIVAFDNKKGGSVLGQQLVLLAIIMQGNDTPVDIGIKPYLNYRKYKSHLKALGDILNCLPFFFRTDQFGKLERTERLKREVGMTCTALICVNNIANR
jgi:hypothetical protein